MQSRETKSYIFLGVRVGIVFLLTVAAIVFVAYYILSNNFRQLMTSYTIKLVQATVAQGVDMVESELEIGRKEISMLAASYVAMDSEDQVQQFPQAFSGADELRMTYVSKTRTFASDGRERDIRERADIRAAFAGNTAIHGPYFNEEREFVICYSAPVRRYGKIVGVLSLEKNGFQFCKLIESIRFGNSGESYIINAEGTDIAVSDARHIDWVTSEYNAQKIFAERGDAVTRSILELESKGLAGERGIGTYYWNNGLCYVVYAPIPSVDWVLLAGLREEELVSMQQSALFSLARAPVMQFSCGVVLLLTGLIIFWIISSMKKHAEINKKLEIIANHDPLTGLLNRRFLETSLTELWKYPVKISGQAAIFMFDIDNFKKYNDLYGHLKGDDCLRHVADVLKGAFNGPHQSVMRYGGEEFIAVVFLIDRMAALELGRKICRMVEDKAMPTFEQGVVTISIGVCHTSDTSRVSLLECIKIADSALYQAKEEGKNRAVILTSTQEEPPAEKTSLAVAL